MKKPMEMPTEIATLLEKYGAVFSPTGSRFICDPAPTDTDEDYLVIVSDDKFHALVVAVEEANFAWDHGEHYDTNEGSKFVSYHRDKLNLIITADTEFADRHKAATRVCKALNLLKKDDRVLVFSAVLYGNKYYEPDLTPPADSEVF